MATTSSPSETVQIVAGYIAFAVPITAAVTSLANIALEWMKQRHTIKTAQVDQSHQITTHYLDKALDPTVPLAIRHQLLRFLSTPDSAGSRLSDWAASELGRVGGIVDETNRAVAAAEVERQKAATASEIANAERKLADAVRKQKSLLDTPVTPPITAAALRAGLVDSKELNGLSVKGQNLSRAYIGARQFRGADFSGSNLTRTSLYGSDLRVATFNGAILEETDFQATDLRGADFSDAVMHRASFRQARLEGADMRGKGLETAHLGATYDKATLWPEGFDPVAAGAVCVDESVPGLPTLPAVTNNSQSDQ